MEFEFLKSLIYSLAKHQTAKVELNAHIAMLEKAKLSMSDINPTLWGFVTKVLRGNSVRAVED